MKQWSYPGMALTAAYLIAAGGAASAEILLNGSFESPLVTSNSFQRGTPSSWQWSGPAGFMGNGDLGTGRPLPQDGWQYVDIGNYSDYALSQAFTIETNGTYLLRWNESAAAAPPGYQTSPYSVSILDSSQQEIASSNFDAYHDGAWAARSNLVSLQPGTFSLRFRAEGDPNGTDTMIDNVSLKAFALAPATDVVGTIINQVWTSNESPYRVVGDVLVANLTIRPGVTVLFGGNYVFEVAGKLNAIGTAESPIFFTAPVTGWQGLFFNSSLPGSELAHCVIERAVNSGIRIVSSAPIISDCVIRSNTVAMNGEGDVISLEASGGGIKTDSALVLDNCTIHHNSVAVNVRANQANAEARGGGLYTTAPLTLLNCRIFSNSVSAITHDSGNGSTFCEGGGVWAATNLTVQSCVIRGNSSDANSTPTGFSSFATSRGGGVFGSGPALFKNSIMAGNMATGLVNFALGGWDLRLGGGGAYCAGHVATIENCTLAFNYGDGLGTATNATKVINSILWGNVTNQIVGTTNVTYSDVQGGFPGVGNINGNPIFLSSSDLIVVPGSPCINAGHTNAASRDVYFPPSLGSGRNDIGAHGGPGAGARLRARYHAHFELIFLGGVPGYTYLIEGSVNLRDWEIVENIQIARLGDAAHILERSGLPHRFYRVGLMP